MFIQGGDVLSKSGVLGSFNRKLIELSSRKHSQMARGRNLKSEHMRGKESKRSHLKHRPAQTT